MAVIKTTDIIDTSILMKSQLPKNMVTSNYYIENLQHKRDQDWNLRYNVVGIEKEDGIQDEYVNYLPAYVPIDVAIRSVKGEKGQDLGMDWASISFRDLKYPNEIGMRYRFSLNFPDMSVMSEDEKHYNTSVWLAINKSPISPRNSCVVRRCNCNIALVGSYDQNYSNLKEIRYEPAVIDNENKYTNVYTNMVLSVPQAEYYLTLQLNYFTNCIKINQRIMLGGSDTTDTQNNTIFKVKSVAKIGQHQTFLREGESGVGEIPLLVLALDRDENASDSRDDYYHRVAFGSPIYKIPYIEPINEYAVNVEPEVNPSNTIQLYVKDSNSDVILPDTVTKIMQGDTVKCQTSVTFNGKIIDASPIYTYIFEGIKEENWGNYFEFVCNESEQWFSIKNLKLSKKGTLKVNITYTIDENTGEQVENVYIFKLGGFY